MSDTISDFITVIRNASRARKETCLSRYSRMQWSLAQILRKEGYVREVEESEDRNGHKAITLKLKYVDAVPAITGVERRSRPGRRQYYRGNEIPRVLGGLGVGILTTSKGVKTDREARRENIGGEMICAVW